MTPPPRNVPNGGQVWCFGVAQASNAAHHGDVVPVGGAGLSPATAGDQAVQLGPAAGEGQRPGGGRRPSGGRGAGEGRTHWVGGGRTADGRGNRTEASVQGGGDRLGHMEKGAPAHTPWFLDLRSRSSSSGRRDRHKLTRWRTAPKPGLRNVSCPCFTNWQNVLSPGSHPCVTLIPERPRIGVNLPTRQ